MKTKILIIVIALFVIIFLALYVKIKPFDSHPANHVDELQKIAEVKVFYDKYGDNHISVFEDGAFSYQIGFQAKNSEDQWIMLKLNYRLGFLYNTLVHCTPDGIQSQHTVRDGVLEYLLEENCFNQNSKVQSVDEFDKTWGGPGNHHPAFLGYDIPKICTEKMLKHLVKYSSMFDRSPPYALEWIGLDNDIDVDDFDECVEELLKRNPKGSIT